MVQVLHRLSARPKEPALLLPVAVKYTPDESALTPAATMYSNFNNTWLRGSGFFPERAGPVRVSWK